MSPAFDTLAAAEALRAAGMEPGQARAVATQLRAAASAGDAVTPPALEAALAKLKTQLLERMADSDQRMADLKAELLERIAKGERALMDRIAALLWRLFGGVVAVVGLAVAVVRLLPSGSLAG